MTPKIARRARLRWDAARDSHVLLYPEGVLLLTEQAAEVIELVDGQRPIDDIVSLLAARYPEAPREQIDRDARELLERLRGRGFIAEVA